MPAAAFRQCLAERPDVILCGHLYMLPLALLVGWLVHVPVWLQIHGIDAWEPRSRWIARNIQRVALVSSVSRYTRSRFLAWAGVPPERVRVLPNTVGEIYRPLDREAVRRRLELEGCTVLLTVGRLASSEAYKGHDRVLRGLGELRSRHPDLVYLIAGSGDDQPRLERLAGELDVTDCTRFLGQVSGEHLMALYAAADLFVMPSTGEGFGIVYLEAMGCGTPALGLDEDGSRDPLRDGTLGYVATRDTLVQTIDQALSQPRAPDLAERTRRWFGQACFRQQLAHMLRATGFWRGQTVA